MLFANYVTIIEKLNYLNMSSNYCHNRLLIVVLDVKDYKNMFYKTTTLLLCKS